MFDIGWSELLVVAVVMIIVVGPKELPGMLRAFGKTMSQVRRTANDFKRQFNDALEEAEAETGLKETADQMKSIGSINPVSELSSSLDEIKDSVAIDEPAPAKSADTPKGSDRSANDQLKTSGSDAA